MRPLEEEKDRLPASGLNADSPRIAELNEKALDLHMKARDKILPVIDRLEKIWKINDEVDRVKRMLEDMSRGELGRKLADEIGKMSKGEDFAFSPPFFRGFLRKNAGTLPLWQWQENCRTSSGIC
ncbi:MAG: hypothetical protein AB2L14_20320 [Candidatus Xenobiia bacterium LiM19]